MIRTCDLLVRSPKGRRSSFAKSDTILPREPRLFVEKSSISRFSRRSFMGSFWRGPTHTKRCYLRFANADSHSLASSRAVPI